MRLGMFVDATIASMSNTQFSISLPEDVAEAMESARGDVPRSIYMRRALEQRLVAEGHLGGVRPRGAVETDGVETARRARRRS
jgi:hypothetical protein